MVNKLKLIALSGVAFAGLAIAPAMAQTEKVDQVVKLEGETIKIAQQSQTAVEKLDDDAQDLLDKYRNVGRQIDDTRIYNAQLSRQVQSQVEELKSLDEAIADVSTIRRQITPLMLEMIDTLGKFVERDIPFNKDARLQRVTELRGFMDRGDVSAAEQFRQIVETYQRENEFGRTIGTYSGSVVHDGGERQVDFLRIGRVFLGYKGAGDNTDVVGVWDKSANGGQGDWVPLGRSYARAIQDGINFASNKATPSLLMLPVSAPEAN